MTDGCRVMEGVVRPWAHVREGLAYMWDSDPGQKVQNSCFQEQLTPPGWLQRMPATSHVPGQSLMCSWVMQHPIGRLRSDCPAEDMCPHS